MAGLFTEQKGLPAEFSKYIDALAKAKRRLAECLVNHEANLEKLRAILSDMIEKNQWAPLVLLCAYFPENWGKLIKCEALLGFWTEELNKLLPEVQVDSPDQLSDDRHPFDIIAGRFCFYKGYSSIYAANPLKIHWLNLGANYADYLCCDRLIHLNKDNYSREGIEQNYKLALIAAKHHAKLGCGLAANYFFRVGAHFEKEKNLDYAHAFLFIADKMIKDALRLAASSQKISMVAVVIHNLFTQFKAHASVAIHNVWETKPLEITAERIKRHLAISADSVNSKIRLQSI